MKIGVQLYSIRDHFKTPQEIDSSFKRLKSIGYDMVQTFGYGPCTADEFIGLAKDNGIEICGSHSPWESIGDSVKLSELILEHKKMGAFQIGIGAKPGHIYPDTYEGYSDFIKKCNEICEQTSAAGLSFGYHNHDFEFMKLYKNNDLPSFDGKCAIDRLIDECPKMDFTLDVFWVQAGGANPLDYIDKLKDRIKILHLKDYRISGGKRQFAEIGQGNLDWQGIFDLCKKYNIPFAVVEQDGDFWDGDPFKSLEISRKYIVGNGFWG